jgi:hypothetical protein
VAYGAELQTLNSYNDGIENMEKNTLTNICIWLLENKMSQEIHNRFKSLDCNSNKSM